MMTACRVVSAAGVPAVMMAACRVVSAAGVSPVMTAACRVVSAAGGSPVVTASDAASAARALPVAPPGGMRAAGVLPVVGRSLAVNAARSLIAAIALVALVALVACGAGSRRVASASSADDTWAAEPDDERRAGGDDSATDTAADGDAQDGDEPDDVADARVADAGVAHDSAEDGSDEWQRALRGGPPVAEVVVAAYAAAGLAGRVPGQIAVRARLGGLVPWVSVRTGRDASWRDEDPDVGRGTTLEVRATWRLDRLVFDGRELQVVALEAARRRERRKLATHVIRTYFAWKRSRSRSRAEEAAAELDALTSGWFSETSRRAASESRTVRSPAATP